MSGLVIPVCLLLVASLLCQLWYDKVINITRIDPPLFDSRYVEAKATSCLSMAGHTAHQRHTVDKMVFTFPMIFGSGRVKSNPSLGLRPRQNQE